LEKEQEDHSRSERANANQQHPLLDFDSMNFAEMETEINSLVRDHEEQATKAFLHIRSEKATKVLKTLEREKQSETNKQTSLYSLRTSKKPNEETTSKMVAQSFDASSH
jgi:hypothetical protein